MSRMNYHHLYYFWRVANTGNLTQLANEIHLSQSAISAQLKQFQQHLGIELLTRKGRSLILTPEGEQVLAYADDIFSKGKEIESLINKGLPPHHRHVLIGVLSNLSRNFVESFTLPLINDKFATFSLHMAFLFRFSSHCVFPIAAIHSFNFRIGVKRHILWFILTIYRTGNQNEHPSPILKLTSSKRAY